MGDGYHNELAYGETIPERQPTSGDEIVTPDTTEASELISETTQHTDSTTHVNPQPAYSKRGRLIKPKIPYSP